MIYENVKLWFAKDDHGEIVTIDEINKNNTYSCPICGSDLKPKALTSKRVTPHFAHVDASKCNSETMIHWWFKHKFLEKGDKFTVISDVEKDYVVDNILTEQSYQVENGTYKPDVTILTECGEVIYFEMAFTNKKSVKDYLDSWIELGNMVVEIDIKDLMFKNELPKFKALFYDGKCFNMKRNDTYYNTIGKYKEEKFKDGVDKIAKERIRKLDWFWDDLFRYKKSEIDIEEISLSIDSIDERDKRMLNVLLKKNICSGIYEDYIDYKIDQKYKEIKDLIRKKYGEEFVGIIDKFTVYELGDYRGYLSIEILPDERSVWNPLKEDDYWFRSWVETKVERIKFKNEKELLLFKIKSFLEEDNFTDLEKKRVIKKIESMNNNELRKYNKEIQKVNSLRYKYR